MFFFLPLTNAKLLCISDNYFYFFFYDIKYVTILNYNKIYTISYCV